MFTDTLEAHSTTLTSEQRADRITELTAYAASQQSLARNLFRRSTHALKHGNYPVYEMAMSRYLGHRENADAANAEIRKLTESK